MPDSTKRLLPRDGRIWLFPLITVLVLAGLGLHQYTKAEQADSAARTPNKAKLERAQ